MKWFEGVPPLNELKEEELILVMYKFEDGSQKPFVSEYAHGCLHDMYDREPFFEGNVTKWARIKEEPGTCNCMNEIASASAERNKVNDVHAHVGVKASIEISVKRCLKNEKKYSKHNSYEGYEMNYCPVCGISLKEPKKAMYARVRDGLNGG